MIQQLSANWIVCGTATGPSVEIGRAKVDKQAQLRVGVSSLRVEQAKIEEAIMRQQMQVRGGPSLVGIGQEACSARPLVHSFLHSCIATGG